MNHCPDQRVSNAEKHTEKWFRQMADYVISLAVSSNDKEMTKQFLNAANGILSSKDYEYVLKTYMSAEDSSEVEKAANADLLGKLRDVDILTPIKEKYMGEFINSYHNYQVYSLDPTVILKRNSELGDEVQKLMFNKLNAILLEAQGKQDPRNPGQAPDINIGDFIKTFLEDWKDKTIIEQQNALELLNTVIESKRKYIDAYFYWFACEEVYTHRRLSGNDVLFNIIDPLEYYRVDSGNYFVEDDHYGLRRYGITIQDAIDTFYNNMEDGLTEEQVSFLKSVAANTGESGVGYVNSTIFLDHRKLFPDDYKWEADVTITKKGMIIPVDHYVFKTEVKKGILTYHDLSGEVTEMDVDEDYVLSTKDGDISIEWMYINQMWEGWRFGTDGMNLYIPPRPVDIQRELISNTSVCKNPYGGMSYIHKSNSKKPIPYRIKDNLALYKIYTLLEERWIAKFKSWLLVPESLLSDSKEMRTEERLQQADIDAILPFNDTLLRENPQALQSFREVATSSVVEYIKILNQVKESIKAEAWELANMNDSRFGGNNQYKGKAVSEYDYNQAIKGTVWSLEMFNAFRERDYMANLDFSRVAWIDGKQGSFVDENTKELKVVNIDGESHLGANVGIFVSNSAELDQQAKALQQIAFSMGQNDDPDIAAEAITNKNISKLRQCIKEASKAKKEFQLKMATAGDEAKYKLEEIRLTNDREQRQHEKELNEANNQSAFDIAVLESDTDLEINRAKLEVDTNGNGYIDNVEADNNMPGVIDAKSKASAILAERQQVLRELMANHKMKMDEKKLAISANKPKAK